MTEQTPCPYDAAHCRARVETAEAQRDEAFLILEKIMTRDNSEGGHYAFMREMCGSYERLKSGGWKPDPRLGLTVIELKRCRSAIMRTAARWGATDTGLYFNQFSNRLHNIISAIEQAEREGRG